MAEIRAVGFDLDGTLFDHLGAAVEGANAFFRFLGVEPSDESRALWFAAEDAGFEQYRRGHLSHQGQRRYRLRMVLPALGIAAPDDDAVLDVLFQRYLYTYRAAWRAFADVAPTLRMLRADGVRIGVLTNGSHRQQVDKLRVIGILDLVDVVCTAEELDVWKPDPRAFAALAERLGVTPSECLFIGDHPEHDVAGAIAVGMAAALIDRYAPDSEGLGALIGCARSGGRAGAHRQVDSAW